VNSKQKNLREALTNQLTRVPGLPEVDLPLAAAVRDACVQAALAAYEDAAMSGLCHEGAWECAVDAIRSLDVERLIAALPKERQHA
jgi:hypothetical protein